MTMEKFTRTGWPGIVLKTVWYLLLIYLIFCYWPVSPLHQPEFRYMNL